MLNEINHAGYANVGYTQKINCLSSLNSSSIFHMPLQRVWQTAYNLIFLFRQIIVHIYIRAYNLICIKQARAGGGCTEHVPPNKRTEIFSVSLLSLFK
jgi:hypothetical protein